MPTLKSIIIIAFVLALGYYAFALMAHHDHNVEVAAQKYEDCVLAKYRTTPSQWFEDHGEYPVCQN